jgi:hypothetical protein
VAAVPDERKVAVATANSMSMRPGTGSKPGTAGSNKPGTAGSDKVRCCAHVRTSSCSPLQKLS